MKDYTHLKLVVACHDHNGFWTSPYITGYKTKEDLDDDWKRLKDMCKHFIEDKNADRVLLIDQYNPDTCSTYDTILVPANYADEFQKNFYGKDYEKCKFDIYSVTPPTVRDYEEEIKRLKTI